MNELLNAMIELVVLWSKVVFAAPLRVTNLPSTIGGATGGACHMLRGEAGVGGQLGVSALHPWEMPETLMVGGPGLAPGWIPDFRTQNSQNRSLPCPLARQI